jgi:hypothetical protein
VDKPAHNRARIRRILASKNVGAIPYWDERGKARFGGELLADGIPADQASALIAKIDAGLHRLDLDEILQDLRGRHSSGVESSRGKSGKREDRDGDKREDPTRTS